MCGFFIQSGKLIGLITLYIHEYILNVQSVERVSDVRGESQIWVACTPVSFHCGAAEAARPTVAILKEAHRHFSNEFDFI